MAATGTGGGDPVPPPAARDGNPPPENPHERPALDPLTFYVVKGSPIDRQITMNDTPETIFTTEDGKYMEKTGGKHQFSPWSFVMLNCRVVIVLRFVCSIPMSGVNMVSLTLVGTYIR